MTLTTERKAKSPYQRYGKVPFRYSAEVYACIKACSEGKRGDYDKSNAAFWARINRDRREARAA